MSDFIETYTETQTNTEPDLMQNVSNSIKSNESQNSYTFRSANMSQMIQDISVNLTSESTLTESTLTESILTESTLTESTLTESILTESILTESILTESTPDPVLLNTTIEIKLEDIKARWSEQRATLPTIEYIRDNCSKFQGPYPESNMGFQYGNIQMWVGPFIDNNALISNIEILETYKRLNIGIYINLCAEYEQSHEYPKYHHLLDVDQKMIHFKIKDCRTVENLQTYNFCLDQCKQIVSNDKKFNPKSENFRSNVYLHCQGGHGRTGVVLSVMLMILFGLNPEEAMLMCQTLHNTRVESCRCWKYPEGWPSPQTKDQIDQVINIYKQFIQN
jgi:protein-tyrosine phosphatase